MTNLPALREDDSPFELGKVFAESGMFPNIHKAAEAIVKIVAGREFGLGPMASMNGIHMVDGKPTLAANLIAGQIKRHPLYNYKVVRREDDFCELEFFERPHVGSPFESVGKMEWARKDAVAANLVGKKNWKQYPRDMYFARCLTAGARTYCPDVLGGSPIYTAEELGEEDTPEVPRDQSWDDAARRDAIEVATDAPSRHAKPEPEPIPDAEVVEPEPAAPTTIEPVGTISEDVLAQLRAAFVASGLSEHDLSWGLVSVGVESLPADPSKEDIGRAMRGLTLEQAFKVQEFIEGKDDAVPGSGEAS